MLYSYLIFSKYIILLITLERGRLPRDKLRNEILEICKKTKINSSPTFSSISKLFNLPQKPSRAE